MSTVTTSVILAAGLGTRMRSRTAKVLHRIGGRPLVAWVLDSLEGAGVARHVVVVGHQRDRVAAAAERPGVSSVVQEEQRGTGHAVQCAAPELPEGEDPVLVTVGDAPLVRPETYAALLALHAETGAAGTVLTARPADPTGYGRVVRGADDRVLRIVEHRDADASEREVGEVNSGIFAFRAGALHRALGRLTPENDQGEYYLTDAFAILAGDGEELRAFAVDDPDEVMGINDRRQLAAAEGVLLERKLDALMIEGVTIVLPRATYVQPNVEVGRGSVLEPFCALVGETRVGERCRIGSGSVLTDVVVEAGAVVAPGETLSATRVSAPGGEG